MTCWCRITSDTVATLGAGVDGTIRRIQYAYDSQGNLSLITSADANGTILNQVQRVYNGLGQLTGEYQSHSGVVVQGVTPEVQYNYNEMSNGENNSRLVSIIYPNNVEVDYNYNTGLDDSISRLSGLSSSGATLVSFKYLGLSTVVEMDNPATNINLTYIQQTGDPYANTDGGDQYTGLDRFGRIIDQFWINATNGTTVDRYQYGYNQDGDVLYRQNLVVAAMSEVYTYDNLNQLTSFARGTLNSTKTGIQGTPSRTQSYTPDALGNFTNVTTNGTAQNRTANQQNEYTSISGSGTISYDANGNMTADGTGNTYVYDAWNRLVTIKNNGATVASYSYDGLNRQIQVTESGTTTDLYVSAADQVLTEYQGGAATAYNVWNPEYVNALLFHNQGNGYQYQRWYVLQDANWNVTALVDASQNVLERYAYDPFGAVTVMSGSWNVLSHSYYNVPNGYQGMRYDWTTAVNMTWARVYDPALMRWTQADPLGLGPDNNDYRMEGNGPTDAVDPSGLMWSIVLQANGTNGRGMLGNPAPTMPIGGYGGGGGAYMGGGLGGRPAGRSFLNGGYGGGGGGMGVGGYQGFGAPPQPPLPSTGGTQLPHIFVRLWRAYIEWGNKTSPWHNDPRFGQPWYKRIDPKNDFMHSDWPWYAKLEDFIHFGFSLPMAGMTVENPGGIGCTTTTAARLKTLESQYDPTKVDAVTKSIGRQIGKLRLQAAAEAKAAVQAVAMAQKGKIVSELQEIGRQASTKTGSAARILLERMAERAGLIVKSGGEHLRVETPGGRLVTTIPHSPKGSGTIRSIAKDIVENIQD